MAAGCACVLIRRPFTLNLFPFEIIKARNIHSSTPDMMPKYRNIRKKIRIHREKMSALEYKYNKLDIEDRPTGCILCPHRNPDIEVDYKNVRLLSQFVSPHTGRIYGRKITGLCERKQKEVRNAIQRARIIGLMPVTMKYFDFHGDPKLF